MGQKEELFNEKLKDIFIGEEIKGKSGFANLMKIKSSYFDEVFSQLNEDIEERVSRFDDEEEFKKELYDKLYTFLKKYFSDSGSIYFTYTPLKEKIYEQVYDNKEDVTLFWKTHMLYYVKTDTIWNELTIENKELDGEEYDIKFDVSEMEGKKANEKKKIKVFLEEVEDNQIEFSVDYDSYGMSKTAINDIRKGLKKEDIKISNDKVRDIVKTFRKQNEVDFFINKDAEGFLKEQFDLWLKQYVLDEKTVFKEKRLQKIKAIRDTAYDIINFVSQFEEELKKIWNKPKFALNSNYVITLDKIMEQEGGKEVIEKLQEHEGWEDQVEEWEKLEIIGEEEEVKIFENTIHEKRLKEDYQFLPIDTSYFEEIKFDIISLFDDLEFSIDGYLIHSENYQALNTISNRFKEDLDCIYIDPPFNKESEANYSYRVKYKDSTWITLLENRFEIARDMLSEEGSLFARCDFNGNSYMKELLSNKFGKGNFLNEIVLRRSMSTKKATNKLLNKTDSLFLFAKDYENHDFYPKERKKDLFRYKEKLWKKLRKELNEDYKEKVKGDIEEIFWMPFLHMPGTQGEPERVAFEKTFNPPEGRHWAFSQENLEKAIEDGNVRLVCQNCGYVHTEGDWRGCPECGEDNPEPQIRNVTQLISTNWTDIQSYSQSHKFKTENSEELLKRVIQLSTEKEDTIMDYFLGIGTTTAVAHKLGRKWIGVEMGDHFSTFYEDEDGKHFGVLGRMKRVLGYDGIGIAKDNDVEYSSNNAGGFFKYYDLEQYEQALKKCTYEDSKPFKFQKEKIYDEYVFLNDEKMLDALDINKEDEKIDIDLAEIYPNVDIAETLSNVKGKKIKQIKENSVKFRDGEIVKFDEIEFKDVKPLIWWD